MVICWEKSDCEQKSPQRRNHKGLKNVGQSVAARDLKTNQIWKYDSFIFKCYKVLSMKIMETKRIIHYRCLFNCHGKLKSFLRLSLFFEPSPTIKKLLKPRCWGMIFYLLCSMYHTCKSHKEAISCNGFPFNRTLARHQVLQNKLKKPNLFLFRVGCTNFLSSGKTKKILSARRSHFIPI